jgi:methylated-DNA-[protein]-cysteine S-methyltransferase
MGRTCAPFDNHMTKTNHSTRFAAVLPAPTFHQDPPFAIGIRCDDDQITGIEYLPPCAPQPPHTLLAKETVRQLRAWLQDPHFVFGLPLAPAGTHFQRRVWQAIAAIPTGETRSYGDIAAQLGSGARAVGNACGANPYPVIVPCHRVIAANQGLGGFARNRGGFLLDIKRWLLQHERS